MEAGHRVFCSEDSCNGGTETKDYCVVVAFPLPRGKMSSDFLLATACCSGTPDFPRKGRWMREMVACALVCICAARSER